MGGKLVANWVHLATKRRKRGDKRRQKVAKGDIFGAYEVDSSV
jgi:hypothetical protein